MDSLSYLNGANAEYIDTLYQAYKADPSSVEFGWQNFLKALILVVTLAENMQLLKPLSIF